MRPALSTCLCYLAAPLASTRVESSTMLQESADCQARYTKDVKAEFIDIPTSTTAVTEAAVHVTIDADDASVMRGAILSANGSQFFTSVYARAGITTQAPCKVELLPPRTNMLRRSPSIKWKCYLQCPSHAAHARDAAPALSVVDKTAMQLEGSRVRKGAKSRDEHQAAAKCGMTLSGTIFHRLPDVIFLKWTNLGIHGPAGHSCASHGPDAVGVLPSARLAVKHSEACKTFCNSRALVKTSASVITQRAASATMRCVVC